MVWKILASNERATTVPVLLHAAQQPAAEWARSCLSAHLCPQEPCLSQSLFCSFRLHSRTAFPRLSRKHQTIAMSLLVVRSLRQGLSAQLLRPAASRCFAGAAGSPADPLKADDRTTKPQQVRAEAAPAGKPQAAAKAAPSCSGPFYADLRYCPLLGRVQVAHETDEATKDSVSRRNCVTAWCRGRHHHWTGANHRGSLPLDTASCLPPARVLSPAFAAHDGEVPCVHVLHGGRPSQVLLLF